MGFIADKILVSLIDCSHMSCGIFVAEESKCKELVKSFFIKHGKCSHERDFSKLHKMLSDHI